MLLDKFINNMRTTYGFPQQTLSKWTGEMLTLHPGSNRWFDLFKADELQTSTSRHDSLSVTLKQADF